MTVPVTWVIGASGLLGRHTYGVAQRRGHLVLRRFVPWQEDSRVVLDALRSGVDQMLSAAGDGRWNVVWVAGAGVVGSAPETLELEREVYSAFLDELGDTVARRKARNASLFLASSAGGVYAGSLGPPFTETTPVRALAAYGKTKLAMEESTRAFVARTGVQAMIGRISNLYGPGQDVTKAQGLVSQLAKAHLSRSPISLYVSLDTMRDYLYVGDCARVVVRAVELMQADGNHPNPTVKIVASGRSTTVAELLGVFQRLFKRRAPLVLGDSPNRKFQVRDLRMRSHVWTDLDRLVSTPLPAGIGATINDLSARIRAGELSASR